ncbi:MAG TPA: DUF6573 family protein [Anaerolineaceae bacterium]
MAQNYTNRADFRGVAASSMCKLWLGSYWLAYACDRSLKIPVAITEMLHNRLTPTRADQGLGQDYDGRLWDVLWLAALTIKLADQGTDTVTFTVVLQVVEAKSGQPQNTDLRLRAVCGSGDEGEPVKACMVQIFHPITPDHRSVQK